MGAQAELRRRIDDSCYRRREGQCGLGRLRMVEGPEGLRVSRSVRVSFGESLREKNVGVHIGAVQVKAWLGCRLP